MGFQWHENQNRTFLRAEHEVLSLEEKQSKKAFGSDIKQEIRKNYILNLMHLWNQHFNEV